MTAKQKAEIIRMRKGGATYKRIAEILGLSVNTVKSCCRRNSVKKDVPNSVEYVSCLQCGRALEQKEKVKRRKFCSPECRVKWWNSHPEAVNRRAVYKIRCGRCGKTFMSYGNRQRKYCSHKCYIEARFGGGADD